MIALLGGLMFPPMAASAHGLRMGSTRIMGTHAIECAAGVPEPHARQRTGELHSAVFWAGSEIGPVSPHQNNDAIMSPDRGMAQS